MKTKVQSTKYYNKTLEKWEKEGVELSKKERQRIEKSVEQEFFRQGKLRQG